MDIAALRDDERFVKLMAEHFDGGGEEKHDDGAKKEDHGK